jgi:hypothetical protein
MMLLKRFLKRGDDDRREHAGNIQFVYYYTETIATIAQLRLRHKGPEA